MSPAERKILPWSRVQLVLFRFLVLYFAMFALSHLFIEPFGEDIRALWEKLWDRFVPWVGLHVFGIEEMTARPVGSGDTTYNYVQIFVMLVFAGIGGLVWSLLDRRRRHYDRFAYVFTMTMRYYLAFVMFTYGIAKVIKTQFPLSLDSLVHTYGESSPMRLLWTFMGYSTPYNIFTGLAEATGGLLLLFRRTTTLGALVVVGAMSNVVMLNFSYDVPVKIFSVHLLLFAAILALRDARRLVNVFVLNRPAPPADLSMPVPKGWPNYVRYGLKIVVIGAATITSTVGTLDLYRQWGEGRERPPLYGLYEVDAFAVNGDTLAPLLTDSLRWRNLIVEYPDRATIRRMNGERTYINFSPDTAENQITLFTNSDTTEKALFAYAAPDTGRLTFHGVWAGDTLAIDLRRRDASDFLLVNRGFHWINEFPFNR